MRLLVSGTNGLIGHRLIDKINNNYEVHTIIRENRKQFYNRFVNTIIHDFSSNSDNFAATKFPSSVDTVVHLAQSEYFRDFPNKASNIFNVNVSSTLTLLEYARQAGAKTFVLASSGGIYGHGDTAFGENAPPVSRGDLGFYLGSKLCAELLAESYSPFMNVIILRFFFVYGPTQRKNMLVPRLIQRIKDHQPIELQEENGIYINPIYVDDAVQAIINAFTLQTSEKINIAGGEVLHMRMIGNIIGDALNISPQFIVQPNLKPKHLIANVDKMQRLLYIPTISFKAGISHMING